MKFILIVMLFLVSSIIGMDRDPNKPATNLYEPISNLTYPPEAFAYILEKLSFKDQQALTSTCTYLRNFSIHAKTLHPIAMPKRKRFVLTDLGFLMLTCTAFFAGCAIIGNAPTITSIASSGIATGIFLAPRHIKPKKGLLRLFIKEQKLSRAEKDNNLLHATQVYNNIAQRMTSKLIAADALRIDYYNTEHIKPLIAVAHAQKIPTVSLDLYTSAKKPFLLSSLPRNLTNLSITLNGSYSDSSFILHPKNFTRTLKHSSCLTHLTLSFLDLTHSMLNAIFNNKTLRNVTLLACATSSHYDFQALIENKSLSLLVINYFTNHDTGIDRDTIIHICNRCNLASLKIKSYVLTDDAIIDIYENPRRPAELSVSNY